MHRQLHSKVLDNLLKEIIDQLLHSAYLHQVCGDNVVFFSREEEVYSDCVVQFLFGKFFSKMILHCTLVHQVLV